jgi:Flp pilus assembly protein TadD
MVQRMGLAPARPAGRWRASDRMNSGVPNSQNEARASRPGARRASWVILGTVCALVVGFFAWSAKPGWWEEISTPRAEDAYYNLLVQGFRAGQLNLKMELPAGFAQLPDPYDPTANAKYREDEKHPLWDLSYYHGKMYLYFGITPALVLFWPYEALTGHYLWHKDAMVVFCAVGFLAGAGLLYALWRRYFPEIGLAVVAAGTLALGLAAFTPINLARANIYEVAISCGYALTMLALLALWEACHRPEQRARWLAAASLAYGLAIGARPTALFGAVILLIPVVQAWREGRMQKEEGRRKNEEGRSPRSEIRGQKSEAGDQQQATRPPAAVLLRRTGNLVQSHIAYRKSQILVPLLAAVAPITFIGLGLMLYNTLRFDNPQEFGTFYQLNGAGTAQAAHEFRRVHDSGSIYQFGSIFLHALGFNSWVYFLAPARWGAHFPFVHEIQLPRLPAIYNPDPEHPFGVLSNIPLVWLAVAAPLAWRGRSADARRILRGFLVAVAVLFGIRALTLGLFPGAGARYQMDFCPVLVLLAVVGILGLERALADRPAWRRAARWAWGLLLAFSLAFNLLASAIRHAEYHWKLGTLMLERGQLNEATAHLQKTVLLRPDDAEARYHLSSALEQRRQMDEAIRQLEAAIRLKPDYADAHNKLGTLLVARGQVNEAIAHFQNAVALQPDDAGAQKYLGALLLERGQVNEALAPLQKAVALRPDDAGAHYNLGIALDKQGQMDEAIRHYHEALRLKPDDPETLNNLGTVLDKQGHIDEAIRYYQETLRLNPDHADAHNNLGADLDEKGQTDEAIRHYRIALRLKPDHADAHNNLGAALVTKGQFDEAISQFQEAIRLKPADPGAHNNLGLAHGRKGQTGEAIRQFQEAIRLKPDYAEAHCNLGIAFGQEGRSGEAIGQLQEALRLKPDYADARRNLDALLAKRADIPPPAGATNR